MKTLFGIIICFLGFKAVAQNDSPGILLGTVLDEKNKALENATVVLVSLQDSSTSIAILSDKNGAFSFSDIAFGYYRLRISYVGFQSLLIDSLHFRPDRYDFNLNDIQLKTSNDKDLEVVIIYAEKPLIESKDGNITFNAGESALSAGSNASDLLTSVPLVTKDPTGKLLVRGKEPKILIDDKPVELNLQQLQDLLESMPGSSVEKIEVMTNPPPQYASEQGGVINIVTKKGTIGKSGRLSVYGGTRGEAGVNGSFNYRKQGLSLNINAGTGYNYYEGNGNSQRTNADSSKLNTVNDYANKSLRPNFRANLNDDLNKFNSFNFVVQYNQNDFDNHSLTQYRNRDRNGNTYRLTTRNIQSVGDSYNPYLSFSYLLKTKKLGETLRLISDAGYSSGNSTRNFYQEYFNPDYTPTGVDSTQQQVNDNKTRNHSIRLNYELPWSNKKTFLSLGTYYTFSRSDITALASYKKESDNSWVGVDALTNDFRFEQHILNGRASFKQLIGENLVSTAGINAEQTSIHFDLPKYASDTGNRYWSLLPFFTINKSWKEQFNLSLSFRRTIRRPGINELNPTIDFSDPYNIRFGNPGLIASLADNYDLVFGKTNKSFYANVGMGYNNVHDIFAQVRTLLPDGKTQITWQNISGRKEYEISNWSGFTLNKHTRLNLSASYTYNTYSQFDKTVRNYRNGGSLTSNLNTNYTWKDLYTATGNFTFNRFANPQGTVKSSLSMNIGLQARMLRKKFTATLNIIDPFIQQENRTTTYGTNFVLESFSTTQTRNFRLTLAYNFSKLPKKKITPAKQNIQKILKSASQ